MKKFILNALAKTSLLLMRVADSLSEVGNSIEPYKSLDNLDKQLAKLIPEILSSETFYIEAGANDGIRFSNTYFLEKIYGAKGILIEASPSNFEQCLRNRSNKNIFELKALTNQDNHGKPLKFIYSDMMTTGFNSKDVDPIEHTKRGLKFFNGVNYEFLSEASTLSNILDRHSIKQVDILSLDLEGAEIEALEGAELEKNNIINILIETRNIKETHTFLIDKGYELIEKLSTHDYLFSRKK